MLKCKHLSKYKHRELLLDGKVKLSNARSGQSRCQLTSEFGIRKMQFQSILKCYEITVHIKYNSTFVRYWVSGILTTSCIVHKLGSLKYQLPVSNFTGLICTIEVVLVLNEWYPFAKMFNIIDWLRIVGGVLSVYWLVCLLILCRAIVHSTLLGWTDFWSWECCLVPELPYHHWNVLGSNSSQTCFPLPAIHGVEKGW